MIFNSKSCHALDSLDTDIKKLNSDIKALQVQQLEANTKIDTYQKASGQIVNLAFALISAATVTVIVSAVVK